MDSRVRWAFQVSHGSVETLLRCGEKCLHHFASNLFRKQFTRFCQNCLSFVRDITKTYFCLFSIDIEHGCVYLCYSYHGEKLQAFSGVPAAKKSRTRRAPDEVFISTVYDDPETTDPPEPLLRRSEPTSLKYRTNRAQRFCTDNNKH